MDHPHDSYQLAKKKYGDTYRKMVTFALTSPIMPFQSLVDDAGDAD